MSVADALREILLLIFSGEAYCCTTNMAARTRSGASVSGSSPFNHPHTCIADRDSSRSPREPIADIYVGPQRKHFAVSRKLLCAYSINFNRIIGKMLSGKHKETFRTSHGLIDEEPEAFEILLSWMSHESSDPDPFTSTVLANGNKVEVGALGDRLHLLSELYCLSEHMFVLGIRSKIISKIHELLQHRDSLHLQPRTVRKVLRNLPKVSTLSELVLDAMANDMMAESGHYYELCDELLKGPGAVQGLEEELLKRMKGKTGDHPQQQGLIKSPFPPTRLEGEVARHSKISAGVRQGP